jgi:peroxiredoxin
MRNGAIVACSLGAALAVSPLPAQWRRGAPVPPITWVKAWNGAPATFGELAGKVVVVAFVHTNCENSKGEVPQLNALHAKYAAAGLVVLGVSEEAEGLIESTYVKGVRAAYPLVKSNDIRKQWGIRFLPSTWVIDANGLVHTLPDVGPPDDTLIDELLQGLPVEPRVPAGAKFEPLRQLWVKSEFAKLHEHIGKTLALPKLDRDMQQALVGQQQALAARQERALARIAALGGGPDYAAHCEELERAEKAWGTLPPAAAARAVIDRMLADAKIKKEITAGRALRKLLTDVDTSKLPVLRKLIEDLDKFRRKHADTYAGKQATAQQTRLSMRPKPE